MPFEVTSNANLGLVVQNFVYNSLTLLLSTQLTIYRLKKQIHVHCNFLLKKCVAKHSHIFSTKNNSMFVILPFEILMNR